MKSFSSIGWAVKNAVLGVKVSTLAIISTAVVTSAIIVNEVYKSQKRNKAPSAVIAPAVISSEKSDFHSVYDDLLFSPVISEIISNQKTEVVTQPKTVLIASSPVLIGLEKIDLFLNPAPEVILRYKSQPIIIKEKSETNISPFAFSQEDLDYFTKYGLEREIVPPSFRGDDFEWEDYIEKHLKYPKTAIKNKVEGTVVVNFEVDKDGSISNAFISKSISKELDKEALRLVSSFPNWNSAIINDQEVPSRVEIPVKFVLQ